MTPDLESFVVRAESVLEGGSLSDRDTRIWLVDPFLATLGWDVTDDALTDVDLDGTTLEYVCRVDSTPAVFVATESATDSLVRERAVDLVDRMRATGVDRAIYTNGREFALFVGLDDVDSTTLSLAALPERGAALEAFSASTARDRLARHSRTLVARRLAVERRPIVDAIADELVAVAGRAHRAEFESAVDRFLGELRRSFLESSDSFGGGTFQREGGPEPGVDPEETVGGGHLPDGSADATSSGTDPDGATGATGSRAQDPIEDGSAAVGGGSEGERGSESEGDREDEPATDEHGVEPTADDGPAADDEPATDDEGEYVVRFFDGGRSIGAIGHSTSAGALVHAAEYLLERGLSGVELPWAADGGSIVLTRVGSDEANAMTAPRELPNGYCLETAGSVEDRARRVEALASRAGKRAMLTGDWEGRD